MAKNQQQLKPWLEFSLIILVFVLPVGCLVPWDVIKQTSDFVNYYAASALMHSGQYSQIYNPIVVHSMENTLVPNSARELPFLISPALSWIFYPLALLKINISLYIWMAMLWLMVIVSYLILCSEHQIKGVNKVWLAAFIATSGPYLEAIRLCQLSPILLLGLTLLYSSMKRKQFVASAIGQSLLLLKPHLLLPVLFFEINTFMVSLVLFTGLISLAGITMSCMFAGFSIITSYLYLLMSNEISGNASGLIYSPTLRGQLLKFSLDPFIAFKIVTTFYIMLLIFSLLLNKRTKSLDDRSNTLFTVIVPLTLCSAPHLHNYDLLLLLPGIVLLSSYQLSGALEKLRSFTVGVIALVLTLPGYIALHYFYVLRDSLINPFFWTVLLFAIGAFTIELKRRHT